jgi:transposase
MLGVSVRTFRRWTDRFEEAGRRDWPIAVWGRQSRRRRQRLPIVVCLLRSYVPRFPMPIYRCGLRADTENLSVRF